MTAFEARDLDKDELIATGDTYESCKHSAVNNAHGKAFQINSVPATEVDPHGKNAHTPGAKLDSGKIRPNLILSHMPRALMAVAEIGTFGANKYTDGGWLSVPNGFDRYTAAMDRHRLKEALESSDPDSGLLHQAHLAWNALARLELLLREKEGKS